MKRNNYIFISEGPVASMLKASIFIVCLLFISAQVSAQNASADKTIKGVVKFSEDNEPAPGVNIYLKGSTAQGTYSDANGQFDFPFKLKTGDVLLFSFIGRKTTEYMISDQSISPIEIVMDPEYIEMVEDVLVEADDSSRRSRRVKRDR